MATLMLVVSDSRTASFSPTQLRRVRIRGWTSAGGPARHSVRDTLVAALVQLLSPALRPCLNTDMHLKVLTIVTHWGTYCMACMGIK